MERETLKEALQRCEELEREMKLDLFGKISEYIRQYKTKYGEDEWIESFTSDYLDNRRFNKRKNKRK